MLHMKAKRSGYQSVIVPTILHGAEMWVLRVVERRRLDMFEVGCWVDGHDEG